MHYYLPMDDGSDGVLKGDKPAVINGTVPLVDDAIKGKAAHLSSAGYLKLENTWQECFDSPEYCPSGFTLAFWIKIFPQNSQRLEYFISVVGDNPSSHGIVFYSKEDRPYIQIKTRTHAWGKVSLELHPGLWNHVAITWAETPGLLVYTNGTNAVSDPVSRVKTTPISEVDFDYISIGGSTNTTAGNFYIDELHFWSEFKRNDFIRAVVQEYTFSGKLTKANASLA